MLVSDTDKFVFLRNPKTATRSLTLYLQEHHETKDIGELHGLAVPDEYADYCVFMFIRNPFSRAVSAWQHVCRWSETQPTFPEFLQRQRFPVLGTPVDCFHQTGLVDWVLQNTAVKDVRLLRFEDLESELATLPFIEPNPCVPEVGKFITDWKSYYTAEIEALGAYYLEKDIEDLGYSRSPLRML